MEEIKTLNTVIVLRNDIEDNWKSSTIKLDRGEVGLSYRNDGKVVIKAGDGEKTWVDLSPINCIIEPDSKTIDLKDEVLSLHGFNEATEGQLARKSSNGELEWVSIDAIVQGDGNKITRLTSTNNSVSITTTEDSDNNLIYDLSVTPCDLSGIEDQLAGINAVITGLGTQVTTNTAAISGLNEAIANINHFTTKIVASTDEVTEVGVLYLIKDETATGKDVYNEYLFFEDLKAVLIGDTSTDLSDYVTNNALTQALDAFVSKNSLNTILTDYVTNTSLAATIGDYVTKNSLSTTLNSYAKAAEVVKLDAYDSDKETIQQALNEKADKSALDDYYTSAEIDNKGFAIAETVEAKLATKIESVIIQHTSETNTTEGVNKENTTLTITLDSYTKAETDAKIDNARYTLPIANSETLGGIKSASDIIVDQGDSDITKVAENAVYVNEAGIGQVKSVNVNTLVQDDEDVLILNGGSAFSNIN